MKKYLFLLAFILPFMAMGQAWNFPEMPHKGWKRDDHGFLKLDTTRVGQITKGPAIKGDGGGGYTISYPDGVTEKNGVLCYEAKDRLITGTPTRMVAMPTKDSIVKGWIIYYKHWTSDTGIKGVGLYVEGKEAIAHYHTTSAFRVINPDGTQSWQSDWSLYKIEVDRKPFDLNKYYQFIPENQVVE